MGGKEPKTEFEQTELAKVRSLNANPVGVPLHHGKIEADRPVEANGVEVRGLDEDRAWFFLAFLYEFLELKIDLFEVFYAAGNLSRDVKTAVVAKDFVTRGSQLPRGDYPLMHVLQGIPLVQAGRFIDFLATYRFHRPAFEFGAYVRPEQDWCCNFTEVRLADPTVEYRRAVPVWFARPVNMTAQVSVVMVQPPGLLLDPPVFGLRRVKDNPDAQ